MDRWIKCISKHGHIRGVAVQAKMLAQEHIDRHKLSDHSGEALAEVLVGALFFAALSKGQGRVNLKLTGSNSISQAFADAYSDGTVRGYLIENTEPAQNLDSPWGEGVLSVVWTKDIKTSTPPFVGNVPLVTGHFAKDLTFYWVQSEQTPTAIAITTQVKEGRVTAAGGFLVQSLPGATEQEVSSLESDVREISEDFAKEYLENSDPKIILAKVFQSRSFNILEEKELRFDCKCSHERVTGAIQMIGQDEINDMIEKAKPVEINCDFCTKKYTLSLDELKALLVKH